MQGTTLSTKVALAILILGLGLTLGSFAVLQVTVTPTFEDIEVRFAEKDRSQVLAYYETRIAALSRFTADLAESANVYDALENADVLSERLGPDSFAPDVVNLLLVYGPDGELLYGWANGRSGNAGGNVADALRFDPRSLSSLEFGALKSAYGIIAARSGFMQVIGREIENRDAGLPVAGYLVVGRDLQDAEVNDIARRLSSQLALDFTPDAVDEAMDRVTGKIIYDANYRIVVARQAVRLLNPLFDIFGNDIGVLDISVEREVSALGRQSLLWTLGAFAIGIALFAGLSLFALQYGVVSPLRKLTALMARIRRTGKLDAGDRSRRSDEIGQLAREFEGLTAQLNSAYRDLRTARDDALQLSKSKSEFLARMSHEIRTPMNGVIGMTEILRQTPLTDRQEQCVQTIRDSGATLLALINDILDFSKMDAGKLDINCSVVDLRELLEETVQGFAVAASQKQVELVSCIPVDAVTRVEADVTRLRQVLVNLLGNAVKFTEHGDIQLTLRTALDGDTVRANFEVADTGIGIHPDKQAAVFDAFTQEDGSTTRLYGGTGLGLAISHQLVELMGGELRLESEPGVGTCFYFELPLKRVVAESEPASLTLDGTHILVVDANPHVRALLEDWLSFWGATGEVASSRRKAEALLRDESFDLVMVEIGLQRDGAAPFSTRVREVTEDDVKIVTMGTLDASPSDAEIQRDGLAGHVTKPLRLQELREKIDVVLGNSTAVAELDDEGDDTFQGVVLLAEDNQVNQAVATAMLERLGLDVEVVNNGQAAFEAVSERRFDLVLMDCQMPELDGFGATARIRDLEAANDAHTPIVALTANALQGDRERCIEAGMDDYLSKPFTLEQLSDALRSWLKAS